MNRGWGEVPRKPYGRKRPGSRWAKKYAKGLYRGPRRLAELMSDERWRTIEELAELMETSQPVIRAWFSLIRQFGGPEFTLGKLVESLRRRHLKQRPSQGTLL